MKIAIVGAHRKTKGLAPFSDQEWTIWSCSPTNADTLEIPRSDAWFEIHSEGMTRACGEMFKKYGRYSNDEEYHQWLKRQKVVYMPEVDPDIPGSKVYPKESMLAEFGPYFFTSTIAWMLAYAVDHKPEEIGMWGIEGKDEWGCERPGILHFVQIARDLGIKVTVPQGCGLLDAPVPYGSSGSING